MEFKSCYLKEILESVGFTRADSEEEFNQNTYHEDGFEESGEFKIIWTIEEEGINKNYWMWFNEHYLSISGVEY